MSVFLFLGRCGLLSLHLRLCFHGGNLLFALFSLGFCIPSSLSFYLMGALEKTEPESHIHAMEALGKGHADTAESLMVSGLCFDSVLNGDRSALALRSGFHHSAGTYTNWFGEGADDKSGEFERYGGHDCVVAFSGEKRSSLNKTEQSI